MPFMQAIGMEKDELVQALGVFFTVATRGAGLQPHQRRPAQTHRPRCRAWSRWRRAFAGMFIGQAVRSRLQPDAFRRWFLIAMILLGILSRAEAPLIVRLAP